MTIDSSWLAAFKREHPHAFRPAAPFRYKAAFVDGQIKLMQVFLRSCVTRMQVVYDKCVC